MKIVLDTNVLVSGLLSPFGPPGEIVKMVVAGDIGLCYDNRIFLEYKKVLARPEFGFLPEQTTDLLFLIEQCEFVMNTKPLKKKLPDIHDEPFLEVAMAAGADYLVTGNIKHYPREAHHPIKVATPREFIEAYRNNVR